jgi:hypothetical protein
VALAACVVAFVWWLIIFKWLHSCRYCYALINNNNEWKR